MGDHALKLNGRLYHYLPKNGGCGGLEYIIFDALQSVQNHGTSMNKDTKYGDRALANNVKHLYAEFKEYNYLVRDCQLIGGVVCIMHTDANVLEVAVHLNTLTNSLDAAAITSDRTTQCIERLIVNTDQELNQLTRELEDNRLIQAFEGAVKG